MLYLLWWCKLHHVVSKFEPSKTLLRTSRVFLSKKSLRHDTMTGICWFKIPGKLIVNSILRVKSTDFRIFSEPFLPPWLFGEKWSWLFGVPGEKIGPLEAILFDLHENLDPNRDCVPIILSFRPMKSDKPRIVPFVEFGSALSFSLEDY